MNKKNKQSGFTLVELMVVVAIIGILITIAVPNLTRFQAKAKQSAAKAELAGLYTAEKAFSTEYGTYHGYLGYIGYIPEGCTSASPAVCTGNNRLYNVGFAAAGIIAAQGGLPAPVAAQQAISYPATNDNQNLGVVAANGAASLTTATTGFDAQARGRISGAADDVWEINQDKALKNVQPGI